LGWRREELGAGFPSLYDGFPPRVVDDKVTTVQDVLQLVIQEFYATLEAGHTSNTCVRVWGWMGLCARRADLHHRQRWWNYRQEMLGDVVPHRVGTHVY